MHVGADDESDIRERAQQHVVGSDEDRNETWLLQFIAI